MTKKSRTGAPRRGTTSKKARDQNQLIVFIDESRYQLDPPTEGTWAPQGETPTIRSRSGPRNLSTITALGLEPESTITGLWFQIQREYFDSDDVTEFLGNLARDLPSDPIFVLDNWNVHTAAARKLADQLEETPTDADVEFLPTYAPDLNPTECIWRQTKSSDLANFTPPDLESLEHRVQHALADRQGRLDLQRSCFEFAQLEL